ncbi:MAG: response regulator [Bacteroidota bacterium]|nr:response regulator [Bacteroidota bacterium]
MGSYNWEHKTILIAEDEEMNFLFMEAIIESSQASILWASNGIEAVELMKQHPDTSLILMDIRMPEMDGIEATLKIREFNTTVPIIAQTAYSTEEDRNKCLEAGCNEYLTKPISHKVLLSTIERFLSPNA